VTIGAPYSIKESTQNLSSWINYIEGSQMVKSLINLSRVYKDLAKEKGLDIDWGKVEGTNSPMEYTKEFGFKTI
jgi:hypothetical protein